MNLLILNKINVKNNNNMITCDKISHNQTCSFCKRNSRQDKPQTPPNWAAERMVLLRPLSITAVAALLHAPAVRIPTFVGTGREVGGRRGKNVRAGAGGGGWLSGLLGQKGGGGAPTAMTVTPGTVKAGDPVLHEPAQVVAPGDVPSEKIQGVIDQMISVMREAPGVGLAAPQIGVPLKVICAGLCSIPKDRRYIAQPVKFTNDRLLFWRTPKSTSAMLPRRTSMHRIAVPLIFLWVYLSV